MTAQERDVAMLASLVTSLELVAKLTGVRDLNVALKDAATIVAQRVAKRERDLAPLEASDGGA